MINRARCRPVARFFYGITGRCNPRRRTSTERDRGSKSLGGEGETRLSDTVLLTFWKTWIFLKFWHFKIEFLWQRQLCHYVRRCMCIRASEESFSCVASITFLPQKTADILNHAQRQRANSKNEQCISSSPLSIRDPPFVIGCLTGNSKTRIPNPWNGPINESSQKRLHRFRQKTKTKLTVMFLPG